MTSSPRRAGARRALVAAGVVAAAGAAAVLAWRACRAPSAPARPAVGAVDAGARGPGPARDLPARPTVTQATRDGGADGRALALRAVDPTGQPVAGATLSLEGAALAVAPASLAIAGATTLVVGAGEARGVDVEVVPADAAARAWPVPAEPALVPEGAATPAGAVVGVVAIDGARAPDVTIELIQLATFGPGHRVAHDRPLEAPRDARVPPRRFVGTRGEIRIDGVVPGSYLAVVHAPGRGAALVPATVTPGAPADVSTELPPAASIGGTAKDTTEAPLADAVVRLRVEGVVVRATVTDARGVWLLDRAPVTGQADLELDAPGCAAETAPVTLSVNRTTRVLVARCE